MFTLLLVCVALVVGPYPYSCDAASPWSYHGDTGPENWAHLSGGAACSGDSQSPINFDTDNLKEKLAFDDWVFEGFDQMTSNKTEIINNGHTAQINLDSSVQVKTSGGGLPYTYSALQFHFHWGEDNHEGSEHTRNANAYPLEFHIVHWNSDSFPFVLPAIEAYQGLAVLGVWVEVGEENPALGPIVNALENVKYKDEKFLMNEPFRLLDLLPSDTSKFYRYSGSLTTPGCYESVVWTVFADPIQMSAEQLAKFRELSGNPAPPNPIPENYTMPEPHPIDINFRPVQSIGNRTVYASYDLPDMIAATEPMVVATDPMDILDSTTTAGTSFSHPSIFYIFLLSCAYILLRLS